MICNTCKEESGSSCNGDCIPCWKIKDAAWQKRMTIRQDPNQFDMAKLVNMLLTQHWMHECEIIPAYMPPFPREDTRPRCVIKYTYKDGTSAYLRHSLGPLQGYSWDSYGDDMHSPELALVAISQSPAPTRIDVVVSTYGT